MTAINSAIAFNAGSGSDSNASGVGPATPVNGTGASLNATSTVDLSADTPDLSGVSAGDLLWVDTTSGRQFSVIASVDDTLDTVTCDDAFGVTESGRNWGIGGKRATLAGSEAIVQTDAPDGWDWVCELEDDQTLSAKLNVDREVVIRSNVTGTERVITQTANTVAFELSTSSSALYDLAFENTNGTKTNARGLALIGSIHPKIQRCRFGHATNQLYDGIWRSGGSPKADIIECLIHHCTNDGIFIRGGLCKDNTIKDNGSHGYRTDVTAGTTIIGNLIANNGGNGIINTDSTSEAGIPIISGNVIYGNTGDGIETTGNGADGVAIRENIIVSNGGYGINNANTPPGELCDRNAYYNNTSGARNNLNAGDNDITLTADPFTDAANDDFNLNNTAGGGAALRAASFDLIA